MKWQVKSVAAKKESGKKQQTGRRRGRQAATGAGKTGRAPESGLRDEIFLIAALAAAVLLFLCNFGVIGPVGDTISLVSFGILGLLSYAAPVLIFLAVAFHLANRGEGIAAVKLGAGIVFVFLVGIVLDMIGGVSLKLTSYDLKALYVGSSEGKCGGGVIFGTLAYVLNHFLDKAGTILVLIVLAIICIVIITEKSLLRGVTAGSRKVYESAKEDQSRRRERMERRREEQLKRREEEQLQREQEEQERILRMDKKVSGVMMDTTIGKKKKEKEETPVAIHRDDIHEIILNDEEIDAEMEKIRIHTARGEDQRPEEITEEHLFDGAFPEGQIPEADSVETGPAEVPLIQMPAPEKALSGGMTELHISPYEPEESAGPRTPAGTAEEEMAEIRPDSTSCKTAWQEENPSDRRKPAASSGAGAERRLTEENDQKKESNPVRELQPPKPARSYVFPPLNLLKKGDKKGSGDTASQLRETAKRLQQTLQTFGVKVTVTDISQGPTVTRYELQPEPGVKVSKIVNLSDDIKLNLAATDIRIEAPIPGKAAVGIEVPNKENAMVALRDLLESKNFKDFSASLAFAVGKDIAGKTVVADIAKMPHMLIAGSTGSGKSVCINTLIMSILYKASPEDVKMIMVDPKVVELSVYNGIPHLLIPVVTDPKKAAAALHWGVAEMTDRYKKFADFNVRDIKGYNKKAESMTGEDAPPKMPQIVIIVDELADLMMVAPGEVEESICRLAQLARAAGIHLIIATQRPSVDVITGLIKANMPSRIAFAVSSGVDSRTILDMNGAEKLLGKGDMLFYPQGYPKPARIQGAFVSDKEVGDVVDFLKNQAIGNLYSDDIEEQIQSMGSGSGAGAGGAGSERDEHFVEAGRFVIDKDKASIGLLQRAFKIGFNRAARIMDQLYEAGVVGEEEGTKPRKILMSMEQFEQYVEECV